MVLRDHPLMNYRGVPNWPPHWLPRQHAGGVQPRGEIGRLTEVVIAPATRYNGELSRLFLFMEDRGKSYLTTVLFSDATFCRQIGKLMEKCYGRTLEEIGSLDVSGLL